MEIKILQHHIDRGQRANAFHCPIAQAIKEQYGAAHVSVGMSIFADNVKLGDAPVKALEFISRFDRGLPVEPFMFEMET